ncbi:MAG TPA: C-terminal binding protein [Acidimicrobiia bacterium]|nr:C-terminal binding protein [Acidimicrobiia bacterium]
MSRFKVVVSDQVFPSVEIERALLASIDAELVVATGDSAQVLAVARDADAILNTYLPWPAETLAGLEKCRIIARYGIGVDNVDLDAARSAGIVVTNVPDYSVEEVATHTLALILALLRKLFAADRLVREGGWAIKSLQPIRRLSELTVGLFGYGRIARKLADPLRALGVEIVVHDPYVQPGPGIPELLTLEELLARADIVSIHAPLTAETRGIIGTSALSAVKPGAMLVNTSRGPLVDLEALIEALADARLGAAALDVFDREPLDHARIEDVPNLIVTPHMAYYSEESLQESQRKAATQVIKVLTGQEPDYRVN